MMYVQGDSGSARRQLKVFANSAASTNIDIISFLIVRSLETPKLRRVISETSRCWAYSKYSRKMGKSPVLFF